MKKIAVAHYKNKAKTMYINGGKLLIDNAEIVLKCFFVRVATFDKDTLNIKMLPDDTMGYKVVEMSDADNSYELILLKKEFKKLEIDLLI